MKQPFGQHATELKMAPALTVEIARLLDPGKYKEAESLVRGLNAEMIKIKIALDAVDAACGRSVAEAIPIGSKSMIDDASTDRESLME